MNEERFPLSWPGGWKRTPAHQRTRAKFSRNRAPLTLAQAVDRLAAELRRLGATREILSTNVALRLDGMPRSGQAQPSDPGAALYFKLRGADRALACDRWTRVEDNIAAIAAHVEALRAIDRYGVGSVDQAFAGYVAIGHAAGADWWLELGVPEHATLDAIDAAYKAKARAVHPDAGGSHEQMARLNAARDAARQARA